MKFPKPVKLFFLWALYKHSYLQLTHGKKRDTAGSVLTGNVQVGKDDCQRVGGLASVIHCSVFCCSEKVEENAILHESQDIKMKICQTHSMQPITLKIYS